MRTAITLLVGCFLAVACAGKNSAKIPDAMVDAIYSTCGHPGDQGNALGIGQFCVQLSDCTHSTAPLCSDLGDANTHFCTTTCTMANASSVCGTGTMCVCNSSNQCGCTPNVCLGM